MPYNFNLFTHILFLIEILLNEQLIQVIAQCFRKSCVILICREIFKVDHTCKSVIFFLPNLIYVQYILKSSLYWW